MLSSGGPLRPDQADQQQYQGKYRVAPALGATKCGVESSDVFTALADRQRAAETAVRRRIVAGRTRSISMR
jgi:hypothetical protein